MRRLFASSIDTTLPDADRLAMYVSTKSPGGAWMMMKAKTEIAHIVSTASRARRAMKAIIGGGPDRSIGPRRAPATPRLRASARPALLLEVPGLGVRRSRRPAML